MAETLREYLIGLGFAVDEAGWKKYNSATARATAQTLGLAAEAAATGLAVAAMVERIARHYEELYYISQRTGASVENIRSYGLAAKQVGLSVEAMTAAQESFSAAQRMNPGVTGLVKQFSSATDKADQLVDVVDGLKKRFGDQGYFVAARVANLMGLDESTFRMLWMNLDRFKQAQAQQKAMMKEAGLDGGQAAKDFVEFTRELNTLLERLSIAGQRIATDFLPYVMAAVKQMNELVKAFNEFNKESEGRAGMVGAVAAGGLGAYLAKRVAGRLIGMVVGGGGAATTAAAGGAGGAAAGGAAAGGAGGAAAGATAATGATAGAIALRVAGPVGILLGSTREANKGEKDLYAWNPATGQHEPTDELRRQQREGAPASPVKQAIALSASDRDYLVRTVVGEAANQSDRGQAGVAAVVLNRLKAGGYGKSVEEVVTAPKQFEPWQTRRAELMGMSSGDAKYRRAAEIVDKLTKGEIDDPTGGAVNFANPKTVAGRGNTRALAWLQEMRDNKSAIQIDDHLFGTPNSRPGAGPRASNVPFIGRAQADLTPPPGDTSNVTLNQRTEIKVESGPTAVGTAQGVLEGQGRVNGDAVRNLGAKVR